MKTKVCLMTIYSAWNYGSFLQAFALGESLEALGAEVRYLRIRGLGKPRFVLPYLKRLCRGQWKRAKNLRQRAYVFHAASNYFYTCEMSELPTFDLLIVGSDTLWNVKSPVFRDASILWGEGLPKGKKAITYAVSVGETDFETFRSHRSVAASLTAFDAISVRDQQTMQCVERLTNQSAILSCDPTLLLERADYRSIQGCCRHKRFILVYAYERAPITNDIGRIKAFAKEKGLSLISLCFSHEWCDECLVVTPFEFLAYVDAATYIITNTFHGTLFSVIYRKKFLVYVNNNKVAETLEQFALSDRAIKLDEPFSDRIDQVDYMKASSIIASLQTASSAYLSVHLAQEIVSQ